MTETEPSATPPRKRWPRRLGLGFAGLLLLVLLLVALLPSLVSTGAVRQRVAAALSGNLGRPVQLADLHLSWSGDLSLEGLRVADDPAFSDGSLLELDSLELQVAPLSLLSSRLQVALHLRGLRAWVIRDEEGRTNLDSLQGPEASTTPPAEEPPSAPSVEPDDGGPPTLPFREVDLSVRLDELAVYVEDRSQGRTAALTDLLLHVDLHPPEYALLAKLRSALQVDEHELPPLRLDLTLTDLVQAGGTLDPAAALVAAEAALPGIRLQLDGGLGAGASGQAKVAGVLEVALQELLAAAAPFLPSDLADTEARGSLRLDLEASGDPDRAVEFQLAFQGNGVQLSGPLLDGRRLGPVDLRLEQDGEYRLAAGDLELRRGELQVQRNSRLAWAGTLRGLAGERPAADLALGPVGLDLRELHRLALPYLPPEPSLRWDDGDAPRLELKRATLVGPLAATAEEPVQQVGLAGLSLRMPGVKVAGEMDPVRVAGLNLEIGSLRTELREGFPASLDLRAELALAALELGGAQPITLGDLSLPGLHLTGQDLVSREADSGAPLAGYLEVRQALSLESAAVGEGIALRGLDQQLTAGCRLQQDGALRLDLRELQLSAAALDYAAGSGAEQLAVALDGGGSPGLALAVNDLQVVGPLPETPKQVRLGALQISLAGIDAQQPAQQVAVKNLSLGLRNTQAALDQVFPRDVTLDAWLRGDGIVVQGATPVSLAQLELPALRISVSDLRPADPALFGVAGNLQLQQVLRVLDLELPGQLAVAELQQRLSLTGQLADAAEAFFRIPELGLVLDGVQVFGVAAEDEEPLRTGVDLRAELPSLELTGTAPENISFDGLQLSGTVGRLLRLKAEAAANGLGQRFLNTSGGLRLDLAALADLPPSLRAGGRYAGTAVLDWSFDGRLPGEAELGALQGDPLELLAADAPLPFLRGLQVELALTNVAAALPGEQGGGGERISVGGVSTEPAVRLTVSEQGRSVDLDAELALRWVEELPGLPPLEQPLDLRLALHGGLQGADTLQLVQEFRALNLGVEQELSIALGGLRRLAQLGSGTPPALWLNVLGGEAKLAARVGENSGVGQLAGDLNVSGPLSVETSARLVRGQELSAEFALRAQDASLAVGEQLQVEGLDGSLELARRLAVEVGGTGPAVSHAPGPRAPGPGAVGGQANPGYLSEEVLYSDTNGPGASGTPDQPGQFGGGGLHIRKVRVAGDPLPVELDNLQLQLGLPGGLPALERLQVDLLGGTVIGTLGVARSTDGYQLGGDLTFTGLDAERLLPQAAPRGTTPGSAAPGGDDAEVSGQFGFQVPVAEDLDGMLSALDLQAGLTHVGPRTLDRALYALDPAESNEAILEQRRLVRLGSPRWVAVTARYGNLSMEGEVSVAGAGIALPPLERFPLSQLPGLLGLDPAQASLAELRRTLDLLSADRVLVGTDGSLKLTHSTGGVSP